MSTYETCTRPGCSRMVSAKGLCRPHYVAAYGLPQPAPTPPPPPPPASHATMSDRKPREPTRHTDTQLRNQQYRHGPRIRVHCHNCEAPEAREGLCRKHWLARAAGQWLRRDLAEKVPVETLTERQIDALLDLSPRNDWMTILHAVRINEREAERRGPATEIDMADRRKRLREDNVANWPWYDVALKLRDPEFAIRFAAERLDPYEVQTFLKDWMDGKDVAAWAMVLEYDRLFAEGAAHEDIKYLLGH